MLLISGFVLFWDVLPLVFTDLTTLDLGIKDMQIQLVFKAGVVVFCEKFSELTSYLQKHTLNSCVDLH